MRAVAALLCGSLALSLAQLQEVDQQCQDQAECVFKDQCQTFTQANNRLKSLTRGTNERNTLLSLIKGSVCNKAARGVCCPEDPCDLGQTCVDQDQCQEFQQLRQKLTEARRGSPERSRLLAELKDNICDKETKTVCCNPSTASPAPRPTGSCDLSDGSCLPASGECGLSGGEQRIVGGEDTIPGEFPYTALLGNTRKEIYPGTGQSYDVKIWFCGGTLINRRYVVTAGHCQDTRPGKHISVVRLGEYQVTDSKKLDCVGPGNCLPEPQDFSIQAKDITVHPQYENTRTGAIFDIALIRLPGLVNLNSGVSVVCLPINTAIAAAQLNVPDIREGLAGFYTTVVGWGHTEANTFDRELVGVSERVPSSMQQKLAVPVLTSEACTKSLGSIVRGFTLKENMICAGGESGKDSCSVRNYVRTTNKPYLLYRVTPAGLCT